MYFYYSFTHVVLQSLSMMHIRSSLALFGMHELMRFFYVFLTGEDLSPAQLSDVTQIVLSVMNLSDRMDEEMKDPSILLLSETQQRYKTFTT